MILTRNQPWLLLGVLDMVALMIIFAAGIYHIVWQGNILTGALTVALCALWLEKAFLLGKVAGSWFPARFGMNQMGIYEMVPLWAFASLFGVMMLVLLYVMELQNGGDAVPIGLVAIALGRAAIPHTVMGWWSARKMVRMPRGGE